MNADRVAMIKVTVYAGAGCTGPSKVVTREGGCGDVGAGVEVWASFTFTPVAKAAGNV